MRGVFLPWTDRTDEPPRSVVQDLDLASTRSIPGFVEQHGEVWFVGAPVSFDGLSVEVRVGKAGGLSETWRADSVAGQANRDGGKAA